MEQKLQIARYEAEAAAHQRANSVTTTTTSNMGSPSAAQDIISALTPYQSNSQDMQYNDDMMIFQQFSSQGNNNAPYDHPITNMMSMGHQPSHLTSPMHMNQSLQQQQPSQHQQQHLVGGVGGGMMGINPIHQSPISHLQLQMVDSSHMSMPSPLQQLQQSQGNPRDQYQSMMGGADHNDVNDFNFLHGLQGSHPGQS